MKVVSGGQTGVDRAALDIAQELNIECSGWCPAGRKAEDGAIPLKYPLVETPAENYEQRTEWNVRDSDATLLFFWKNLEGGTLFTKECCSKLIKPFFEIDMTKPIKVESILKWIQDCNVKTLNIAGPRESSNQGQIYLSSKKILKNILAQLQK